MQHIQSAEQFAENLRTIRMERGYSQRETADMMELSRDTYASWERGHRLPGTLQLLELAELFQVPINWLLCRHITEGMLPVSAAWDDPCPDEIPEIESHPCFVSL